MKKERRYITKHKFEYLFGERYLAFVEFPNTSTIREIEDELFWAKAYFPIRFSQKGIIVRCHVKTFEWIKFVEVNRKRLMKFQIDESLGSLVSIKTDKNTTTLFNI